MTAGFALAPLTGRAFKILDRFPSFMRLDNPGKALSDVAITLGADLDHAEGRLGRILKARRIEQADEEGDILKLADLLGLVEEDFFLVRRAHEHGLFDPLPPADPADALSEEDATWAGYSAYLDALRRSVMRTAVLMTDGCGTLWALGEGACLLMGVDNGGRKALEHINSYSLTGGFLHRLKTRFRIPKTGGAPGEEAWETLEQFIYILENPIVDKETELAEARQRQLFPVRRGGFFHGKADFVVVGNANRTVKPLVINQTTREGYGYRGVLTDGQELVFSRDGHAYLDGADVTKKCYRIYDGFFDDTEMARFADGHPVQGFALVEPEGAADRDQPGPAVVGLDILPAPRLLHGDNTLRFSVEEGAFDASRFDEAVFELPDASDAAGDAALKALPPSGKFQVKWREHEAFVVRLLLPPALKAWEAAFLSGGSLPKLLGRGLERFRPAGVRLEVDYWSDEWILGESLIADLSDPDGEGVDFNAPIL